MRHTFTLANGVEIPAVGFGTYKAADGQDEAVISEAMDSQRGIFYYFKGVAEQAWL